MAKRLSNGVLGAITFQMADESTQTITPRLRTQLLNALCELIEVRDPDAASNADFPLHHTCDDSTQCVACDGLSQGESA